MKKSYKKTYSLLFILVAFLLSSCTAYKKLPYVTEAEALTSEELAKVAKNYEAKIMPKDVLTITVSTPTRSASADFNLFYPSLQDAAEGAVSSSTVQLLTYIVDNNGYIDFPIVGKLKVGGLTKAEAQKKVYEELYPKYIVEKPIINIRFASYKVTVLGEVAKPGVYSSDNEQMSLFDALALAGDLTIYGKRDNVLLIRENAAGEKIVRRIDLQDRSLLLDNEVYFLQQNDKLYVQPNKARGNNSQFGVMESMMLSGISILLSVISIITR